MPYPLPLTRTEAYLAYKAGVIQQSDLKPSLAVPLTGIDAWLAYWTGLAADYPKRGDGTPHILQEEEAYIAYLCGVINEYPEKCLRRVGAYLRYLISARWGRPDHPLNREELYLSLLKTQVIPSGDPSSDIEIDGTAKAPFVDVKMYGDTFQQSYTGKNLLNYNTIMQTTLNGVTLSLADDGTITLNGTCSSDNTRFTFNDLSLALDGTYTLSFEVISGTITNATDMTKIRLFKSGYSGGIRVDLANTSASSTSSASGDYILNDIRIDNGVVLTNYKIKIQLEKSATATSFEPFVGGTPSPNPDYPQPIQTVTGLQTVEIQGKNLLNAVPYANPIQQGVEVTITNTNTIHIEGTSTQTYVNLTNIFSTNLPAGTYTMSINKELPFRVNLSTILSGGDSPGRSIQAGETSVTFTTSETTTGMRIFMATGGAGIVFDETFTVQLVSGNAADYDFEPYTKQTYPINLGSLELCKIGNYQDYIYKSGSKWYLHKEIWSKTFTGNDAYYATPLASTKGYLTNTFPALRPAPSDISVVADCLCSHFKAVTAGTSWTTPSGRQNFCQHQGGTSFRFAMGETTANVDVFKALMSELRPKVYAVLVAPTEEEITDETLIAQLEALVAGGAENGTTYIKVNATDPNLPGLLYVEAPKYE